MEDPRRLQNITHASQSIHKESLNVGHVHKNLIPQ